MFEIISYIGTDIPYIRFDKANRVSHLCAVKQKFNVMKKIITLTLAALAAIFTVAIASSSAPAAAENSLCIESVDGTPIDISLGHAQVQGMYGLVPEKYRKMLDASYMRFRDKALSVDYGKTIYVDGCLLECRKTSRGDVFTIAAEVGGLGFHRADVRVASREKFISWMDSVILK